MKGVGVRRCPGAFLLAQQWAAKTEKGAWPLDMQRVMKAAKEPAVLPVPQGRYNHYRETAMAPAIQPRYARTFYLPHEGVYLVLYNDRLPPAAVRFSLAHEWGHIVLGHALDHPTNRPAAQSYRRQEEEANVFAGNLLAPPILVDYCLNGRVYNAMFVAKTFGVPLAEARKNRRMDYEYWCLHKRIYAEELAILSTI